MGVTRDSGSVDEGLRKLYTEIAQLKLLPDAPEHTQFLTMLDNAVMKYLQIQAGSAAQMGSSAAQAGAQMGQPPMGAASAMGGMGGGDMGSGAPGAVPAAQFAPGGAAGGGNVGLTPQTDPDELRRMLASTGGVG